MQSRDARQDLALVALLEALPEERLARVLTGIGIEPERIEERGHKADARRCKVCGQGFVRCRALDEKTPADDRHDWSPDRTRTGEPVVPIVDVLDDLAAVAAALAPREEVSALVARRKALGLTQAEVAARMGVTQPTLSELEAEGHDPRLSTIRRYTEALNEGATDADVSQERGRLADPSGAAALDGPEGQNGELAAREGLPPTAELPGVVGRAGTREVALDRAETGEYEPPAPEALWCDKYGNSIESPHYRADRCECYVAALNAAPEGEDR